MKKFSHPTPIKPPGIAGMGSGNTLALFEHSILATMTNTAEVFHNPIFFGYRSSGSDKHNPNLSAISYLPTHNDNDNGTNNLSTINNSDSSNSSPLSPKYQRTTLTPGANNLGIVVSLACPVIWCRPMW
mmetsp:Transcript_15346/g.19181  ORF Transcript_15346/g.19181 Transcript_15346/m.19181 type:complete len:129 (+) Transcript_15346:33-419(+)